MFADRVQPQRIPKKAMVFWMVALMLNSVVALEREQLLSFSRTLTTA